MTYQTEIVHRVWDQDEGHYLTIQDSPEFPDKNILLSPDPGEHDFWGPIYLDLPIELMLKLGEALVAAANERMKK